ncbi:PLP-dependent aminotransferase family protein [Pseudomonas putida]|uniref:aminotransferase-like domain-containing protein n=1 Tax=Pseudomonas putida TaxID=303 RepID=UPI002DBE4AE5|nr:PLP-dependent aminotransferase family protein [Pseudomonas putida]WRW04781.1 PLP-dependent aminotransferase family protein [Pseudomonas putida]
MEDTYNVSWGLLPLRQLLSRALGERGINTEINQIFTTYGGNHALDLIIRWGIRPGDTVLVDDPGYYPLFWKLEIAGAKIIGVNRLHDGPDAEDLRIKAASSGAKFFFTQSLAHNPTGGSLTLGVAYNILKVAEEFNLYIVEDDPFADILPVNSVRLAALDQLRRVIYAGSFSKTLPGSVRVGYVAASQQIAVELNDIKIATIISTSAQNEQLVYTLIEGAHYLKYLRKLRDEIHRATSDTVDSLERLGLNIARPLSGGYYLWLKLPTKSSSAELALAAAEQGIFIAPAEAFSLSTPKSPALRVNVAYGNDPKFLGWLQSVISSEC